MSELQIQVNPFGQEIVSRDGRLLCSPRNPEKEAQEWLARQKLNESDKAVIVLGLGAAYHVKLIAEQFPETKIFVVELDPILCEKNFHMQTELVHLLTNIENLQNFSYQAVLPFRPSWGGLEKEYLEIFLQLTQKNAQGLIKASEREGLVHTASAVIKGQISNLTFSLKDLDFQEEEGDLEEIKLWRCLRELVD